MISNIDKFLECNRWVYGECGGCNGHLCDWCQCEQMDIKATRNNPYLQDAICELIARVNVLESQRSELAKKLGVELRDTS